MKRRSVARPDIQGLSRRSSPHRGISTGHGPQVTPQTCTAVGWPAWAARICFHVPRTNGLIPGRDVPVVILQTLAVGEKFAATEALVAQRVDAQDKPADDGMIGVTALNYGQTPAVYAAVLLHSAAQTTQASAQALQAECLSA